MLHSEKIRSRSGEYYPTLPDPVNLKRAVYSFTGLFVSVCTALSFLNFSAGAETIPSRPGHNTEVRHLSDCTALSEAAVNYYTGEYSYDAFSELPGAVDISDSYSAMQNNQLFDFLHSMMQDTQTFTPSYPSFSKGSLAYYWYSTDSGYETEDYIAFYSDIPYFYDSVTRERAFNMEREHIWAKSKGSFYQMYGGADLHHLRPSVSEVNMAKSDHVFGYVSGVYPETAESVVFDGAVRAYAENRIGLFEVKDDVKGDVARILLYVYCRYMQPNLYSDISKNRLPAYDPDDKANSGLKVIESLDTLLQWIEDDPVDTWEMRRNDLTETVQGNRNVFIDFPELAFTLFGKDIPDDLQTPTHAGCHHKYLLSGEIAPDCEHTGRLEYVCGKCGKTRTKTVNMLSHKDGDSDHYCDTCGTLLTHVTEFTPAGNITDGEHILFYNPESSSVPAAGSAANGKLDTIEITAGDTLYPDVNSAVFCAETADGGYYLVSGGKYLSTDRTGSGLFYADTPGIYSIFEISAPDEDGAVTIRCANSEYTRSGGAAPLPCYLEVFRGKVTIYATAAPDKMFRFIPYVYSSHYSYEQPEAKCEQTIAETECIFCGQKYTVIVPAAGHHFLDGRCTRCGAGDPDYHGGYIPDIPTYHDDSSAETSADTAANTREPKLAESSGVYGWNNIVSVIGRTSAGGSVTVDMNSTTAVPANALNAVKGKDIDLVLDMGGGIIWTINGKDISSVRGSIDLGVKPGTPEFPAETGNNVTGGKYSVTLSFNHSGAFGFKAVLTVPLRIQDAGLSADLFCTDPAKEPFELVSGTKIDRNGNADFGLSRASDCVIIIDAHTMNKTGGMSAVPIAKGLRLTWDSVDGAASYNVYVWKDGRYQKLKTTAKTSFNVTGLTNGRTYGFMVRYKVDGKLSEKASSYTLTVEADFKPVVKLKADSGRITARWNKIAGADRYKVFRFVNGKLKLLGETAGSSVRINGTKAGQEYTIAVKALLNGKWTTVTRSDLVSVDAK